MNKRTLLLVFVGLIFAGLAGATQWVGYRLGHPTALGPSVRFGSVVIYPPWAMVDWISWCPACVGMSRGRFTFLCSRIPSRLHQSCRRLENKS